MQQLRHALRSLRRTPAFALTTIITLILGIGSVTAMFAIVYGVLLAPLPYGHPDRLVSVTLEASAPQTRTILQPPAAYFTYKRFARHIDDVAYYRTGNANIWVGTPGDQAERVTATWITASTISLLQVPPLLGREFTDDEQRGSGPQAVIISESVWRSRFGGSRDVLGKVLQANNVPRVVVGVMPASFHFPDAATRIWLPAKLDRDATTTGDFSYSGIARLKGGVTLAAARADLAAALQHMAELYPQIQSGTGTAEWLEQTRPAPAVEGLRDAMTRGVSRTLWMLGAAAGLVLLVACANVANLMAIRADGRQLELAVREALGAGRGRILTHFVGESALLGGAACVAAIALSWIAIRAFTAFAPPDLPRLEELSLGGATVLCAIVTSAVSAALCSTVPMLRWGRTKLSINLREAGRGDTASKRRHQVRGTIAAVQIAVALVVLAGSALVLRTLERLRRQPPGFDAANVMTIWTQLPFARYGDSASVAFYARLTSAVKTLPAVRSVGVTSWLPLGDGETRPQSFRIDGDTRSVMVPATTVDGGYFGAARIPIVAGRTFHGLGEQRDGEIIISRQAAVSIWNDRTGAAAIGKRLTLEPAGPSYTVIGVAGDVRDRDLGLAPSAMVYVPQAVPTGGVTEPSARRTMALVIRTRGSPGAVVSDVRRVVHDMDPAVPIFNVEAMTDVVRASTSRLSLALSLLSAAAAITLTLGVIGLYGVMAYMVALRTREIGIRIALGADPRTMARDVALRGARLIALGLAGGLVAFAATGPFLRAFLYDLSPADPATLAGAITLLAAAGMLASWLPARRAARVDPLEAMRVE
jgi:predicted permease